MDITSYYRIHYWPGVTCGLFAFTFITTFLISVLNGHVYIFFPYISDTGTLPPESCIFSLLLNIASTFMAIIMYIRYREVDIILQSNYIDVNKRWNTWSIITGIFSCSGIYLVANFQETGVPFVHFLGAVMTFGIGSSYFCIQTVISYSYFKIRNKVPAYGIGPKLFYLRIFLSFWLLPLFITNVVCSEKSMEKFTGESIVWWTEEDGGFQLRLAGSFAEWIMVTFTFIYIATFTKEFKSIRYKEVAITLKETDSHVV